MSKNCNTQLYYICASKSLDICKTHAYLDIITRNVSNFISLINTKNNQLCVLESGDCFHTLWTVCYQSSYSFHTVKHKTDLHNNFIYLTLMCHKHQEETKCSLTGARSIRGNYSRRSHFLAEVSYGPACFHLWFIPHSPGR